jgi:hypothetical protein
MLITLLMLALVVVLVVAMAQFHHLVGASHQPVGEPLLFHHLVGAPLLLSHHLVGALTLQSHHLVATTPSLLPLPLLVGLLVFLGPGLLVSNL